MVIHTVNYLGGQQTRTSAPLERGGELVLFQVPLVLRFIHVFHMQLLLVCWRLSALRAKRWLPPRRPGVHNDGLEVNESRVKGRADVLDTMQRDSVGHHCHVLPFVSEVAERLRGERVGEREELQSVMCAFFSLSIIAEHVQLGWCQRHSGPVRAAR